jgi:hypothetical protein
MYSFRTARWFLTLPLVCLTTLPLVAARPSQPPAACEVAANWVAVNKRHLPNSLAEIDKLPTLYRKAAYRYLTPEARVRIWREKLESYLTPSSTLTSEQRQLVQHVIGELNLLATDSTGKLAHETIDSEHLDQRLVEAFGRDKYRAIFVTIGSVPTTTPTRDAFPACDCDASGPGFDCDNGESCSGTTTCFLQPLACGLIGNDDCTGVCQ